MKKNRKLITRQGEDCTTGCLLDYDYINNLFKLTAIGLSRQKELDANAKAIQQREFVGQLKNVNDINTDGAECNFCFKNFQKN